MINLNWQPGMTLESVEKAAILQAFRFYRGNKTTTAQALGIAIRTLDNKLEKYQTDDKALEIADAAARKQREEFNYRQRGLLPSAQAGIRVESPSETSAQHAVPVPERQEVQSMPSRGTHQGHPRKAR